MEIYNTLSNTLEQFKPISENKLNIYICGITPYDTTHLGHAFTYLSFDVLIRYLKYKGHSVNYTQNVTDINDRDNDILKRAKEQNVKWQDLSKYWTGKFLDDMKFLNWVAPTNYLYASEQIDAMVNIAQELLDNGSAYKVNGSVYLDINKDKDYGKLSKINRSKMLKIAEDFDEDIENPDKKNRLDITIWRRSQEGQPIHIPSFDSPFGKGRPGWHLECSAMAISSLGEQIDIHGGGRDLIFPHHEAEIAQSEGATGKVPFAKYWMHAGQVSFKGEKMSKSLGNLVMVSDLCEKYSANAIRFLLLSNHYRLDWEYKEQDMEKASGKMDKIEKAVSSGLTDLDVDPTRNLEQLIENDLNTPAVLEFVYQNLSQISPSKTRYFLSVLGFNF